MPKPFDEKSSRNRGFWKRFSFGMALVTLIACAMYWLTKRHIIFPIEVLGQDFVFGGSPGKAPGNRPGVTLVEITEEDYECPALFNGKNPLRRDLIYELINKVAPLANAGSADMPKTVVVDIDLSGPWKRPPPATYRPADFACSNGKPFPFVPLPLLKIAASNLVVVQPTRIVRGPPGESFPVLANDKFSVQVGDKTEARQALSLFPYDWDHRARSFLKEVEVRKGSVENLKKCARFPTLAAVGDKDGLLSEDGWRDCEKAAEKDRYFIDFAATGIKHRYTASTVLTEQNLTLDEIVVIGGTYYAGRDSYFTPIGSLPGVELVGLSINALQTQNAIREAKPWQVFIVDFLIGAVLVILDISGLGAVGTSLTLAAIVVLPPLSSLLVFKSAKLFLNFMPIVLGAGAHMIYDRHSEVKHQLKEAKNETGELRKTIRRLELRVRNGEVRRTAITENIIISIEPRRHGDET